MPTRTPSRTTSPRRGAGVSPRSSMSASTGSRGWPSTRRCRTRTPSTPLGRQLYAAGLPRAQAGLAWTRYRIRQAALETAVPLGPSARALLAAIETADARRLPRLGATLYRRQHAGGADPDGALTPAEWR